MYIYIYTYIGMYLLYFDFVGDKRFFVLRPPQVLKRGLQALVRSVDTLVS